MFTTVTYAIKSSLNKIRNIRSIVFMCFYLKLFVNIENYFLSKGRQIIQIAAIRSI